MDSWHATFLGLRHLPREVTAFEIEVFFQFSAEEARIIETPAAGAQAWPCLADRVSAHERQTPRCGADGATATVAALGRTIQRRRSGLGLAARDVQTRPDADRTPAACL